MARIRLLILLPLLMLYGCRSGGSYRTDDISDQHHASPLVQPAVSVSADLVAEAQPASAIQQTSLESLQPSKLNATGNSDQSSVGSLSLHASIETALARNPDLVALRRTEQVGVAAVGVAETYPFNPFVQVQATPYQHLSGQGSGSLYHYVLMMQRIQLARQQQYREDASYSSLNGIRWNIHQAELQVVSLTTQLYFTLLYQRGLLEIAEVSQKNNEQLLQTLMKRFEAGAAAAANVATVRIDTRSTRRQLQLANANYQTALRDFRRQLGMQPDSTYDISGDLQLITWRMPNGGSLESALPEMTLDIDAEPVLDKAWVKSWAASRPDVLAAHANIDVARANLHLATADRVPDLQLGPYYQHDPDGRTRLGFRAEMNIPIVNSGKPLEMQRAAELGQQTAVWRQLQLRAELEAQAAFEKYELAYRTLDKDLAEDAFELPQELKSLERQFTEGEIDIVRIIQARNSILQNQRAYLDLLNEIAQSAALLIGATGMPVDFLIGE